MEGAGAMTTRPVPGPPVPGPPVPGPPQNIRASLRKPLFYEPSVRPTWTEEGQRLVLDILAEDTRRILDYCGKPPGFWDLESPSQATLKG